MIEPVPPAQRGGCKVCSTVPPADLIELDAMMGDASLWPVTVWGRFEKPRSLTPGYRRFGAIEMGMSLLTRQGHLEIKRPELRKHYRFDVPVIATNPDELVTAGIISSSDNHRVVGFGGEPIDPMDYLRYYAEGISLGVTTLKLLRGRIQKLMDQNEEVPLALLKMLVDLGAKLSTSQAAIRAAGKPWGEEGDQEEGFRAGSAPLPTKRVGHMRGRTIEGERRIVRDEGPADRAEYSERSVQEGGPGLPHS